ncbi:hypothetical protein BH09PSE4_BH09PSE4_18710 [soil metagenome]
MNQKLKYAAVALGSVVATLAAGGIALASIHHDGLGHFGNADANNDGKITRIEWLRAANTRFLALDANKDGALASTELPRPPHPRHGPGHRHGPPDWGPDDAAPDQAAPAPAPAAAGNTAT